MKDNMKNQTNNSLFTDIELEEAANVNGGYSSWQYTYDVMADAAFAPINNQFYEDLSNGDYLNAIDGNVNSTLNTLRFFGINI